jgi:hypothetical protein
MSGEFCTKDAECLDDDREDELALSTFMTRPTSSPVDVLTISPI